MSATNQKPAAPRALLGLFMPAALTVIALVLVNLFQPAILNGFVGTIINILFWIAAILSVISLLGLVWHFLRQMAAEGLTFRERLSLGILIPSVVIVGVMIILSAFNPGDLLTQGGASVNQLFWGMVMLMLFSLVWFIMLRFGSGRRRKKKSRMYYY